MITYVALLRGINVNGQKIIKMNQLKNIFEDTQFKNVKTYIQSGNVIFDTIQEETTSISERIQNSLKETLGFEVTVIVRSISELEQIIKVNPFRIEELLENEKIHITLLDQKPTAASIDILKAAKSNKDEIQVLNREVYILCRNGYAKTIYSNSTIEKRLKVVATTRNLDTINKIMSISRIL